MSVAAIRLTLATLVSGASAAALAVTTPTLAEPAAARLTLQVRVTDLQTDPGRAAVRRQLAAAADAFCRGNPGEVTTIYDCRRTVMARLAGDLAIRTGVELPSGAIIRIARK